MKWVRGLRRGASGGFTLVELLVVMGIIIMLVGLLWPAINFAIVVVRVAATKATLQQLSTGLVAFKNDYGVYPPSDKTHEALNGFPANYNYGYQTMAWCLIGPEGRGWGAAYNNQSVFLSGSAPGTDKRTCGPYFQMDAAQMSDGGVVDAFRSPTRVIFYYRYEPYENTNNDPNLGPVGLMDFADNPSGASSLGDGFASDAHFRLLARYLAPDGRFRWRRDDFLLISPGADRFYGYVKEDPDTGVVVLATQTDVDSGAATCDDVANFNK